MVAHPGHDVVEPADVVVVQAVEQQPGGVRSTPGANRRFDGDVLSVPGVTHVLVHFGIDDLGCPA
ncbi:hypothetical protein [Virgisporangium ochraceum]|uniref:hypothetical protein n=1 Tax=Virgisporangium ochraceum TaxID=65505 RepID=UPI001944B518|nr:hypothetical protein [Virgisporangium ochraceum]